jgi:integrase
MRNRYLTHDEIDVLLKNSEHDEDVFLFVLLSVFLGGRANTILNIKRRNIDFYNKKVLLRDFKRNKDYTIPLHPVLYKTLKDKYKDNIYVIGNTNKISYHQMYLKLSPILDDLFNKDIDKKDRKNRVVIHTLRHTFASQLAMSGVSLAYIKNFMHHSNIKMSEKYIHLAPELSNEQIEKLDFKAF